MIENPSCFIYFKKPIETYALPERFTFPFYYEPHPLSMLAADELKNYLDEQNEWEHNFWLDEHQGGIGKMFGVLVVQNSSGEIGYLAAFSGKLAGGNHHSRFVPPVFDMLTEEGFYKRGEEQLNAMNRKIEQLECDSAFLNLKKLLEEETQNAEKSIQDFKKELKIAKEARDIRRKDAEISLSTAEFEALKEVLNKESIYLHFRLKDLTTACKQRIADVQERLNQYFNEINLLKEERKRQSAQLQQQLFDQYTFLNQRLEEKSLWDIFHVSNGILPPSGAGECAAPKLLQYAFQHGLKPVSMAEFWWGQSPSSEVRKHGMFYPACKGKCEPILAHMLDGIEMDENPMLINPAFGKELEIVYEDDYLVVVNKPAEFLSVPGKQIDDSVFSRMKKLYPKATGPLIVHRLDMSTSGLLVIAKTKEIHQNLQSQFIKRKVKKRYSALLEGIVGGDEGFIDLPLRVDLDDRPRQLVCYEYGKPAQTQWQVVNRFDTTTKIHFFPITGRTHQLRVHASHPLGLNMPIKGDDLYGNKADRLYLHAESLEFKHPITGEIMHIIAQAPF